MGAFIVGIRRLKLLAILVLVLGLIGAVGFQIPITSELVLESRDKLVRALGFSLIAPLAWLLILITARLVIPSSVRFSYWNKWLAGLLACPVVWGLLAYFSGDAGVLQEVSFGGFIGAYVKGPSDMYGVIRLIGISSVVLGLAFPSQALRVIIVLSIKIRTILWASLRLIYIGTIGVVWLVVKRSRLRYGLGMLKSESLSSRRSQNSVTIHEVPKPKVLGKPLVSVKSSEPSAGLIEKSAEQSHTDDQLVLVTAKLENKQPENRKMTSRDAKEFVNGWATPPVVLLKEGPDDNQSAGIDQEEVARLIETTLGEYGIEVKVEEIKPGPVVTMFGLVPGWVRRQRQKQRLDKDGAAESLAGGILDSRVEDKTRVKVDSIIAREKDLALALAAPSLRIEAPIPGTSLVGIEVPNPKSMSVSLRSVMETVDFRAIRSKSKLVLGLGKGSGGDVAVADLGRMPHLLIAGSTGSGKSVCINSVIASIIMHNSPWDTRIIMIDPKRVELTPYNGIPHLIAPVIVEVEAAVKALKAMIQEMLRRYKRMEEAGARNIDTYNKDRPLGERMPFIVIAVDELADLMMAASYDIEHSIIRLAQLGRATGIHLVVATQRPSVDVVTGLIKANFPSRISFAVASQVDSRTILDAVGAEKLLGKGDMLFQPPDTPKPRRIQGAFISDNEIADLVSYWKSQNGPLPAIISMDIDDEERIPNSLSLDQEDELLEKAWELATKYSRISTSLLQRRLRIGYPRAARIMDLLEEEGVVSQGEPGKARDVIVTKGRP